MFSAANEQSRALTGLLSVHDVMPETRDNVTEMLSLLPVPAEKTLLLVVPGREWSPDDMHWLRDLAQQGYPLAGHGWLHVCHRPMTLYHRVHSMLLSRMAAEHLSFSSQGVESIIRHSHAWFGENGLSPSSVYVPPAWALGALHPKAYADMPYQYIETLTGFVALSSGRRIPLPLAGFEADTPWRAMALRLSNAWNCWRARRMNLPLRVGLHPNDLHLLLEHEALGLLGEVDHWLNYSDETFDALFASLAPQTV